jgi:hypothetical protein
MHNWKKLIIFWEKGSSEMYLTLEEKEIPSGSQELMGI